MKKFCATLNDMSFINTPADRMEVNDNMVYAYNGNQLVALVEITAVISAHISERGDGFGERSAV